jgi:hypothetical protein
MSRRTWTCVAAALAVTGALARGASPAPADFASMQVQPYEPAKPAPAIALPDLGGATWTLGSARGKVVLLFFWATW